MTSDENFEHDSRKLFEFGDSIDEIYGPKRFGTGSYYYNHDESENIINKNKKPKEESKEKKIKTDEKPEDDVLLRYLRHANHFEVNGEKRFISKKDGKKIIMNADKQICDEFGFPHEETGETFEIDGEQFIIARKTLEDKLRIFSIDGPAGIFGEGHPEIEPFTLHTKNDILIKAIYEDGIHLIDRNGNMRFGGPQEEVGYYSNDFGNESFLELQREGKKILIDEDGRTQFGDAYKHRREIIRFNDKTIIETQSLGDYWTYRSKDGEIHFGGPFIETFGVFPSGDNDDPFLIARTQLGEYMHVYSMEGKRTDLYGGKFADVEWMRKIGPGFEQNWFLKGLDTNIQHRFYTEDGKDHWFSGPHHEANDIIKLEDERFLIARKNEGDDLKLYSLDGSKSFSFEEFEKEYKNSITHDDKKYLKFIDIDGLCSIYDINGELKFSQKFEHITETAEINGQTHLIGRNKDVGSFNIFSEEGERYLDEEEYYSSISWFGEMEGKEMIAVRHDGRGKSRIEGWKLITADTLEDYFGGPYEDIRGTENIQGKDVIEAKNSDDLWGFYDIEGNNIGGLYHKIINKIRIDGELYLLARKEESSLLGIFSGSGELTDIFGGPKSDITKLLRDQDQIYLVARESPDDQLKVFDREGKSGYFGEGHNEIKTLIESNGKHLLMTRESENESWKFYDKEGNVVVAFDKPSGNIEDIVKFHDTKFLVVNAGDKKLPNRKELYSLDGNLCFGGESNTESFVKREGRTYLKKEVGSRNEKNLMHSVEGFVVFGNSESRLHSYLEDNFQERLKIIGGWLQNTSSSVHKMHIKDAHRLIEEKITLNEDILEAISPLFQEDELIMITEEESPLNAWLEIYNAYKTAGKGKEINIPITRTTDIAKHIYTNKDFRKKFKECLEFNLKKDLGFDIMDAINIANTQVEGYTFLGNIGQGALKKAYLARHDTGFEYVLLQIDPTSWGFNFYKNNHPGLNKDELWKKILRDEFSNVKIDHEIDSPYVAKTLPARRGYCGEKEFFFLPTKRYDMTIADFIEDKKGLEEKERREKAIRYFYQMCHGLRECHEEGIIHKDLKPDNIGIVKKKDKILLSDFGCVSMFSPTSKGQYQYPLNLKPPELAYNEDTLREKAEQEEKKWLSDLITPEANVWSAGAIMYSMITGENLFQRPEGQRATPGTPTYHQQNETVYRQIRDFTEEEKNKAVERVSEINPSAGKLVDRCLMKDAEERKGALEDCMEIIVNEQPELLGFARFIH